MSTIRDIRKLTGLIYKQIGEELVYQRASRGRLRSFFSADQPDESRNRYRSWKDNPRGSLLINLKKP